MHRLLLVVIMGRLIEVNCLPWNSLIWEIISTPQDFQKMDVIEFTVDQFLPFNLVKKEMQLSMKVRRKT